MVVIIDYNMGNTGSVMNALAFLGVPAKISKEKNDLQAASHLILPGVGAFGDGMKHITDLGLLPILREQVLERKKPFLGVCLGMQLLAEVGEEGGEHAGLGWLPGRVRRFQIDEMALPVPHVGWNDVTVIKATPLFTDIDPMVFYFTHSYILEPPPDFIIGTCAYGEVFAAAVAKDNIFGVQWHPEKSQRSGLKLLENFINIKT